MKLLRPPPRIEGVRINYDVARLRALLNKREDVDVRNAYGETPLHMVCASPRPIERMVLSSPPGAGDNNVSVVRVAVPARAAEDDDDDNEPPTKARRVTPTPSSMHSQLADVHAQAVQI